MSTSGKLSAGNLQGFRDLKIIPLVIHYAAGAPQILQNPTGELVTLTDNGAGDVSITLSDASVAPLIVMGMAVHPTNPATLGLNANVSGACTTSLVRVVVNSDADGTTETDEVDLHITLLKHISE